MTSMLTTVNNTTGVVYELPINEQMRICTRLEHLFAQFKQHADGESENDSRIAMRALVKILDVIDRPDVKSKLSQALTSRATTLGQLERSPQVDREHLQSLLTQLDGHIKSLHNNRDRLGNALFRNEFLKSVRYQTDNPAGATGMKSASYQLWLKQPASKRIRHLKTWVSSIDEISDIANLILMLTRECTAPEKITAYDGFYHQPLNPTLPCELIRITLPSTANVFPEASVGRHRLTIRFLQPNYFDKGRAEQTTRSVNFELSCCRL